MLSFKEWLKTTCYHAFNDDIGRFVKDVLADEDFPHACAKYVMFMYISTLEEKQHEIFDKLYDEYIHFISRRYPDENPYD